MINKISILTACIAMTSSFCAGQGWLFPYYCFSMVNGIMFSILYYRLARRTPDQRGVYFMMVPAIWSFMNASYGLWRISN